MGNALIFPDTSHYRPGVKLDQAPGLITKATEGATYRDATYTDYRAAAAARGIPFAGFHWVNTADLDAQAHNAYSVLGSTPCMWDCEAPGATVPRILDLTARYRALGGVVHLGYLPHWWWLTLGSPDLRPLAAAGLALVSSNYPAAGYTDDGPGWAPYGGVTPDIWQFTDAGSFGGSAGVDLNAYRGTAVDLRRLFAGGPTTGGTVTTNPNVEDLMNRTINGQRIADLLGELQGYLNNTAPVIASSVQAWGPKLDAIVARLNTISGAAAGGGLSDADRAAITELTAAVNTLVRKAAAAAAALA